MVGEYVAAGFRKIHLDCSMSCADDSPALGDELIADRNAALCEIAEAAWRSAGGDPPGYIIGSEVPVPGGAHETFEELAVTTPEAAHATIEAHRRAFSRHGVEAAWTRVVGLVVQPGVEFNHYQVIDYVRSKAAALSRSIEPVAGMVFEAHSTDYQTPAALAALVQDHFAILKVGPGLTFALRRSVLGPVGHCNGTGSDAGRIAQGYDGRGDAAGSPALERLLREPRTAALRSAVQLERPDPLLLDRAGGRAGVLATPGGPRGPGIPLTLISQYLPMQYAAIREGRLNNEPRELVVDAVEQVLCHYERACRPAGAAVDRGRE